MASNDDLLFAEHAVKAGYLTEADVQESLGVQARMDEMGVGDSLRNVLVKRGVLREGDAALVARSAGLRSGREPIPGYTLEARIGSGAMGSVYRAHQRGMKRHVAIKILRRDLTDDPRQVERLQREAALVGRLDHTNIVKGLDSGETDGLIWFVMDLVDGRTLHQRIRESGPLPPDEAIEIVRKLADALCHAHEHGVVHRDIKPGNILLTKDGEPRLTDYGLAKGESDDALTQLDATLGTPQYISPEQARNPRDADIRSDIYSLGATLYAMLAGRPPFQADTLAATLTKVLYERPEPLDEAAPGTPEEIVYIVQRMMAKDRRHRYPDPTALLRDVEALARGKLTVPAGFEGDIEQFVTTRRRRRLIGWSLAGAVLVTVGAVAFLQWQESRLRADREMRANGDLEAVLVRPGPADTWSGDTVGAMISGLTEVRSQHPGTSAADTALVELSSWRRQESALLRVQELSLRADRVEPSGWPALLDDLAAERSRLDEDPDASVAGRRLDELLKVARGRRDAVAETMRTAALETAAKMALDEAPTYLTSAADEIRRVVYGVGRAAPLAERLDLVRDQFKEARTRLLGHFAAYDLAVRGSDLAAANLQDLEERLFQASLAAEADAELAALLVALPPEGARRGAIRDERETRYERLVAASRRRLESVRDEASRLAARGDLDGAERLLAEFGRVALTEERLAAGKLQREMTGQREANEAEAVRLTDAAVRKFLSSIGRREYGGARGTAVELAALLEGRPGDDGGGAEFAAAAIRLVDLIEERAWRALERRLTTGPLDEGLSVGGGIRYTGLRNVRVRDDRLEFEHSNGLSFSGSLRDIATEDVIRYAGLPGADAAGAAVHAALVVLEQRRDGDPRDMEKRLARVEQFVDRAGKDASLRPVVERIAAHRLDLIAVAQAEIADTETLAQDRHDDALQAIADGRYVDAYRDLDLLLNLPRLRGTRYVLTRRDEIAADRARADRGRATARFAERLPGTRLLDGGQGRAEMVIDFEEPDAERAVSMTPDRAAIHSRRLLVADHPEGGDPRGNVREDRFLAWAPWDGVPEHHPSGFPVEIRNPFLSQRAIEVSFLYRSESPLFLMVVVHGTAAGVLSAADLREGGRGVRIWHATSLDRPDRAFGERFRTQYLERNPEILQKDGDTTLFQFEAGRTYRVRFVKDERDASLFVDGRKVASSEVRPGANGELAGRILLLSYTSGEIDNLRVSGWLDDDWLRNR